MKDFIKELISYDRFVIVNVNRQLVSIAKGNFIFSIFYLETNGQLHYDIEELYYQKVKIRIFVSWEYVFFFFFSFSILSLIM